MRKWLLTNVTPYCYNLTLSMMCLKELSAHYYGDTANAEQNFSQRSQHSSHDLKSAPQ